MILFNPLFAIFSLVVGMHSTQYEVDPEIGDDHTQECDNAPDMESPHGTTFAIAKMERIEIYNQCDECPDLFWVPAPVVAP